MKSTRYKRFWLAVRGITRWIGGPKQPIMRLVPFSLSPNLDLQTMIATSVTHTSSFFWNMYYLISTFGRRSGVKLDSESLNCLILSVLQCPSRSSCLWFLLHLQQLLYVWLPLALGQLLMFDNELWYINDNTYTCTHWLHVSCMRIYGVSQQCVLSYWLHVLCDMLCVKIINAPLNCRFASNVRLYNFLTPYIPNFTASSSLHGWSTVSLCNTLPASISSICQLWTSTFYHYDKLKGISAV